MTDRVVWLEGPHEPAKHTADDLRAIKALYQRKTREIKKSKAE